MPEMRKGLEALDLLVVADPHPTTFGRSSDGRKNGTYLLPICTQFEADGSRTASNRSVQWGDRVVEPIFESKNDYDVMYALAQRLGFAAEMFKRIKVVDGQPDAEDILREINFGSLSTGYSGQSPERLRLHMEHQADFDRTTLKASSGPCAGEYYGLPWPCWGTPEMKHPGTHILYDTSKHVMEGGGTFRARFGVEKDGATCWPRVPGQGFGDRGRLSRIHLWDAEEARLERDLTEAERTTIEKIGRRQSGRCLGDRFFRRHHPGGAEARLLPFGNAKARAVAWNLPDPVPVHREPIYTSAARSGRQYPTLDDRRDFRMPISARASRRAM